MKKGLCKQQELALHTHDLISFKRCRRKWGFSSPFRRHLQTKGASNQYLWFGSGMHYAMEDYHGYNRFGDCIVALDAYIDASSLDERPDNWEELQELGHEMLTYYKQWETKYGDWKTVWVGGVPLVEKQFSLVLEPLCHYKFPSGDKYFKRSDDLDIWECHNNGELFTTDGLKSKERVEYNEIVFHGTLDAVVEDEDGNWWVLDYKNVKTVDTSKLDLDPQISAYCWAAEQYLDHEIEGMIYVQLSKSPPKSVKITKTGVSTDKRQRTTHKIYKKALEDHYGEQWRTKCNEKHIEFLNDLAFKEDEHGDIFIRYDKVVRNTAHKVNTYQQIIAQGKEILNDDLVLYPNPTRDCAWDCPFRTMCLAMEEDADWEFYLDEYEVRNETMNDELPKWQKRMFRKHKDLFPDEYSKYCTDSAESVDSFIKMIDNEDINEVQDFIKGCK